MERIGRWFRVLVWKLRKAIQRLGTPHHRRTSASGVPYLSDSAQQLDEAARIHAQVNEAGAIDYLIERGLLGEREVLQARAMQLGYAFVDLDRIVIDPKTARMITAELAREFQVIPIKQHNNSSLWLAMSNPDNRVALEAIGTYTSCRTIPVMAVAEAIEDAISEHFGSGS